MSAAVAASDEQQRTVRVAARALGRAGLANAYGHCSIRLDAEHLLVCAAMPMQMIDRHEGVIVPVDGPLPMGVLGEMRAHQAIYRRRRNVGAICRFAAPRLLSVSALGRCPRVRHGFGAYFADAPFWPDTRLLRSEALANALAQGLGESRAILMRGNGAITVGETMPQALAAAWFFEDMARVELDVLAAGAIDAPVYTSAESNVRATWDGRVAERMWDYLTSGDAEAPDRVSAA